MRGVIGGMPGAVMNGLPRLHRIRGPWRGCFMIEMGLSPRFMGVISYDFYSGLLVPQLGQCHLGRHRVADPAAQGQQGDHEGEEQKTHGGMISDALNGSGLHL